MQPGMCFYYDRDWDYNGDSDRYELIRSEETDGDFDKLTSRGYRVVVVDTGENGIQMITDDGSGYGCCWLPTEHAMAWIAERKKYLASISEMQTSVL